MKTPPLCLAFVATSAATLFATDPAPAVALTFQPLPMVEVARHGAFAEQRAPGLAGEAFLQVAAGHGLYLGTGTRGLVVRSRDGVKWEHAKLTLPKPDDSLHRALFFGTQFVLGNAGISQTPIFVSPDGSTWQAAPEKELPLEHATAPGMLVGKFLIADDLKASTDARTWERYIATDSFAASPNDKPEAYVFANERHFVFTSNQRLLESYDRRQWTQLLRLPLQAGGSMGSGTTETLVAGNGYVLLAYGATLHVRDLDGAFVPAPIKLSHTVQLAYGGGRFLLAMPTADNKLSEISESRDGLTWTPVATTRHGRINHIAYGPKGFVLAGSGGTLARYAPPPLPERKLPFAPLVELTEGKLITVPAEPIAKGEFGIEHWRFAGYRTDLLRVTYIGGRYVATGGYGHVLSSTDGRTWTGSAIADGGALGQAFFDGSAYAVFSAKDSFLNRSSFVSTDLATWTRPDRLARLDGFVRDARGAFALSRSGRGLMQGTSFADIQPVTLADTRVTNAGPLALFLSHDWIFVHGQRGFFSTQDRQLWRREFALSGSESIGDAWFAEGNNAAVLLYARFGSNGTVTGFGLHVQQGGGTWATPTPPWKDPRGLAYGLGRFVVVATDPQKSDAAIFESTDGATWTRIGAVGNGARSVAFGESGFVVVGEKAEFAFYAPAAKPEAPFFARPAVEPAPPEPAPAAKTERPGGRRR